MVESLWLFLEQVDRAGIATLERLDKLRKRESYLERIQKYTANVRKPQRAIEFDK